MGKIKVTQVRSLISRPEKQRRTMEALGLRKINQEKVHESNQVILGMIEKVSHLVKVEEVK